MWVGTRLHSFKRLFVTVNILKFERFGSSTERQMFNARITVCASRRKNQAEMGNSKFKILQRTTEKRLLEGTLRIETNPVAQILDYGSSPQNQILIIQFWTVLFKIISPRKLGIPLSNLVSLISEVPARVQSRVFSL